MPKNAQVRRPSAFFHPAARVLMPARHRSFRVVGSCFFFSLASIGKEAIRHHVPKPVVSTPLARACLHVQALASPTTQAGWDADKPAFFRW
jgi:hypothetical protein